MASDFVPIFFVVCCVLFADGASCLSRNHSVKPIRQQANITMDIGRELNALLKGQFLSQWNGEVGMPDRRTFLKVVQSYRVFQSYC
jgi:hypothetical protein